MKNQVFPREVFLVGNPPFSILKILESKKNDFQLGCWAVVPRIPINIDEIAMPKYQYLRIIWQDLLTCYFRARVANVHSYLNLSNGVSSFKSAVIRG